MAVSIMTEDKVEKISVVNSLERGASTPYPNISKEKNSLTSRIASFIPSSSGKNSRGGVGLSKSDKSDLLNRITFENMGSK
jgi:hypothetical protein